MRTLANLHLWPSPSNAAKQTPPKAENLGFQSRGPRISTQNNAPKQKNILEIQVEAWPARCRRVTLSDLATCILTVTHAAYKVWLNQFRQKQKKEWYGNLKKYLHICRPSQTHRKRFCISIGFVSGGWKQNSPHGGLMMIYLGRK